MDKSIKQQNILSLEPHSILIFIEMTFKTLIKMEAAITECSGWL